jgi:beta-N-acetylhexosaminidase
VDLREKVGQLFVVDARTGRIDEAIRHVRDNGVGGVIWFESTVAEAAPANEHLQSLARVPLLISADLEAGMGMRFTDAEWWLPAMALAAIGDPAAAEEQGRVTAREALGIGVNHILAPVADVNVNPANPVINTRSFGEDPHEVARYVAAFVRGVQSEGALATAKHFPGHGDTHVDSHRSLPVLDVTRERLESVELVPFRAAVRAGVASVMIGHLAVPAVDPTRAPVRGTFENVYGTERAEIPSDAALPATLSKPVIDILRHDLAFDGLVVTDAMDMGGLAAHFDPGEAAVRAIEAGNDQVLFSPDTDAAIKAVLEAVRNGRISAARIEASLTRVLSAKTLWSAAARPPLSNPSHATPDSLAERAITPVRDAQSLLPLRGRVAIRIFSEDPLDIAAGALEGSCALGEADVIVLLLGTRPRSGAGKIAVAEEAKRIATEAAQRTVVVSFGSPYVLRELGDVSTFVCAWGPQPALQRAAARALRGEIAMAGRMPVSL